MAPVALHITDTWTCWQLSWYEQLRRGPFYGKFVRHGSDCPSSLRAMSGPVSTSIGAVPFAQIAWKVSLGQSCRGAPPVAGRDRCLRPIHPVADRSSIDEGILTANCSRYGLVMLSWAPPTSADPRSSYNAFRIPSRSIDRTHFTPEGVVTQSL